jgi:hypothetical protein
LTKIDSIHIEIPVAIYCFLKYFAKQPLNGKVAMQYWRRSDEKGAKHIVKTINLFNP